MGRKQPGCQQDARTIGSITLEDRLIVHMKVHVSHSEALEVVGLRE